MNQGRRCRCDGNLNMTEGKRNLPPEERQAKKSRGLGLTERSAPRKADAKFIRWKQTPDASGGLRHVVD